MKQDIPGTIIFDGTLAQRGLALNKMCFSFNDAENRAAFQRDEDGYCSQYPGCEPNGQARSGKHSCRSICRRLRARGCRCQRQSLGRRRKNWRIVKIRAVDL